MLKFNFHFCLNDHLREREIEREKGGRESERVREIYRKESNYANHRLMLTGEVKKGGDFNQVNERERCDQQ